MAPVSSKEFLDIQATEECRFTLKYVHDMIKTHTQKNLYFVRKHISKNLVYIVTLVLQFLLVAGYWKCNNETPMPK